MNISKKMIKLLLNPVTVAILICAVTLTYYYIDIPLTTVIAIFALKDNFPALTWITFLGDGIIIIAPLLISALLFRYFYKHPIWEAQAWFLSLCVVISGLICVLLKVMFGRARPKLWFNSHEYGFYLFKIKGAYWSFPSGHTTMIFSLACGLSLLFPRYKILFIILAIFISFSRVLLIQHYLSDILIASYFALLEVFCIAYFLHKKNWLSEAGLK
ncbi:MAG: phosphatase PAP2 family protein [Legionellaceae bacterium]|nr:phosphatase PAP2 family protein [Legionellaceae bacterium]